MEAVRVLRGALERSKLHQGLVMESWMLAVEELIGKFGKKLLSFININRCVDVEESRQNAVDVAVDDGVRHVESNGSNGCCSIVANAFQKLELFIVGGELTIVVFDNLYGTEAQIASS